MAIRVKRATTNKFTASSTVDTTTATLVDQQLGFERSTGNLVINDGGTIKPALNNLTPSYRFIASAAVSSTAPVAGIETTLWTGSTGNYSAVIPRSVHNKGVTPIVETWTWVSGNIYEHTYDSPTVDVTTGNIGVFSNSNAIRVLLVIR